MLLIASQCIYVTIPLPLDLFHPVTLLFSLFSAYLKKRRGSALKEAYGDTLPPLTHY